MAYLTHGAGRMAESTSRNRASELPGLTTWWSKPAREADVAQHHLRRPLFESSQATWTVQHHFDFVPAQSQHIGQHIASVDVVFDDQDSRRHGGKATPSPGAILNDSGASTAGSLTMNSLPQSSPPLRACTVPPCISTIL